ncbi:MAG TPA: hypothetical protein VKY74_25730 [Chloroflexia bacterium]|nr:hypothetical protein [Chloroflexia bacterium]
MRLYPGPQRFFAALGPVLFFAGLTVILTWPLILDLPHTLIAGITADADVSRWDLWWVKTALLDRHNNPFYTDMLYYPYRAAANPLPLYYHTLQPLNALLALPVLLLTSPAVGPTLGYNLLVLGHFILTGCAMFWLVRYLTGSTAGGLVAGVLFTFGPFHQYHLHEAQLELIPIEWLPLGILFLHQLLYPPAGTPRRVPHGVLALGCLIAVTFTSWYWTLYLLLAYGLLALVRVAERPREWRPVLIATGAVLVAWAILVAPFLLATIRASTDATFELVSGLDYEVRFSLTPFDLFTVVKDPRMNPPVWFMGTLGITALMLGALGAARLRRRGLFWGILFLGGAVLALGPYLQWSEAADVAHTTGIPLPYYFVRNLPFLAIARVPRRFVLLANLGLDVLAGVGAAYLVAVARQVGTRLRGAWGPGLLAGVMLAGLVLLPLGEFAVIPQPVQAVDISPFFSQLAAQPGDFGILELPITSHYLRDHARMLNQTVHQKKIIGGYVARRVHDYYLDSASPFYQFIALNNVPAHDIVPPFAPFAVLNYYQMPYIVFYKTDESYEQPGDRPAVEAYLHRLFPDAAAVVYDDAQLTAYRVPAVTPAGPLIWLGNGWQAPETRGGRTWRWSNAQQAELEVLTPTPVTWHLQFTAAAFHSHAHLTVRVNGQTRSVITLGPDQQPYDAGTLSLPAGQSEITFQSDMPPITPIDAGVSTRDARPLGFLITDLRLP